jgi:hypothetical protein
LETLRDIDIGEELLRKYSLMEWVCASYDGLKKRGCNRGLTQEISTYIISLAKTEFDKLNIFLSVYGV